MSSSGSSPPHIHARTPVVSVVIPAFNEERFLERTLHSIVNQTFTDYEIIVVDNNSTDRTNEMARRFGAEVIFERNKGVGYARQSGFLRARGSIVATTDADTVVPVDWLEKFVQAFAKDEDLVAFGGLARLSSGPITARLGARFFYYPFMLVDRFFSGGWNLVGNNMAIRRDAFFQAKGFRAELVIGEDVDISKRLRCIGKVELDREFCVYTSGRRFRYGLIHGLMTYAPSTIMRLLFKKEMFLRFSDVRDEYLYPNRVSLIALLLCAVLSRYLGRIFRGKLSNFLNQ